MTSLHTLLGILISFIWGSMFVVATFALMDFPPVFFTGIRFLLLIVILARYIPVSSTLVMPLVRIGLVMGVGMYLALYLSIALAENTSSIALFSKLEVPFALLLGVIVLKERIGIKRIAGVSVALLGAVIISFDPAAVDDLPALFWMAISSAFSAAMMIMVRRLGDVHPLTITVWVSLVGAPVMMLTSLIFEDNHFQVIQDASVNGWIALAYTVTVGSIVAHSGVYFLLQRYPVNLVSPFFLLAPVFAVIGGVLFLEDTLTPLLIVGGLLVLTGVGWIHQRSRSEKHLTPK